MDDYYSDEEYDTSKEYSKISHLQLQDYLECRETFNILNNEWTYKLESELEPEVDKIFNDYFEHFKNEDCDFLKRATTTHAVDFYHMIKHHLVRDYNMDIFKDDPSLAKPLINSIDKIKEERKNKKTFEMQKNFDKLNKKYNWDK